MHRRATLPGAPGHRRQAVPAASEGYHSLAHRNITIADSDSSDSDLASAVVAGTSDLIGIDSIVLDRSLVPGDYRVFVRIADARLMNLWLDLVAKNAIVATEPVPGITAAICSSCTRRRRPRWNSNALAPPRKPIVRTGRIRGQEVIFLEQGGAPVIELPARLSGGQFVPLVVGPARTGGLRGAAYLQVTQRRGDGELSHWLFCRGLRSQRRSEARRRISRLHTPSVVWSQIAGWLRRLDSLRRLP